MLVPSFFITESGSNGGLPDVSLPENAWLAYRINITDMNRLYSLYLELSGGKQNIPFCLLLDNKEHGQHTVDQEKLIDHVLSFSFHFYYLKTARDMPFLIFKEADSALIALFAEKFKAQGYEGIEYICLDAANVISCQDADKKWIYNGPAVDINVMATEYGRILRSPDAGAVLFEVAAGQTSLLIRQLMEVEDLLARDQPLVYSFLQKSGLWAILKKEMLGEISIPRQLVHSFNNYYSFYTQPESGYKKKIDEIAEFYNNEYEILPLWYKRFGHILKVLSGKRSFRSLFNDNVKKYKI